MLELKDKTEKECRDYINSNANLVFKYMMLVMTVSFAIEKYGLQMYLGLEELEIDKEYRWLDIPIDERRDIYRFMERYPYYTAERQAKEIFKESEYYPR